LADASLNARLLVSGDASLGGKLIVALRTIQQGDVSMNTRLFVAGDASLGGNLFVAKDISLNGNITVGSNLNISTINMVGSQNSGVFLNTLFTASAGIVIPSGSSFTNYGTGLNYGTVSIIGDLSLGSRLLVTTDASLSANLYVAGKTNLIGDVSLNNRLYIGSDVLIGGNLLLNYNPNVNSNLTFYSNNTSFNGDVSLNSRLFVGADTSLSGNLYICLRTIQQGDVSMNSRLFVAGNVYSPAFNVISDRRIKENILAIDGSFATHILRNIQPTSYHFIDSYTQPFQMKWGFVAQDVKSHLDYCSETTTQFVPNVYDDAVFLNSTTLQLLRKSTSLLDASFLPFSLRLYDSFKRMFDCQVREIKDDTTFVLEDVVPDCSSGSVFVYGQQVHDFHTLNHDSIFTVVTAAVKEMDKKIQDQDQMIQQQQKEIDFLKEQMHSILLRLDKP
jgi:hypothetical protein